MIRPAAKIILGLALGVGALPAVRAEDPVATPPKPHREELKVIGLPEQHWHFDVDWRTIAAESLADDRASHTTEERAEFDRLLAQLINQAFLRIEAHFADHEFRMTAEETLPDGLIQRKFTGRPLKPEGETIEFALLLKHEKEWLLQDFSTDEVRFVKVYRSQFRKILQNEGFAVLIAKMKAKIERDRPAAK